MNLILPVLAFAITVAFPLALFVAMNGWKTTKELAIHIWNL